MANENSGKPWSADDQKQLEELVKGNTPTRLIAMKLGRVEDSIRSKARNLDVSLAPANRSPYNRRRK